MAAIVTAVARFIAAFGILREPLLHAPASAWVPTFVGFAIVYLQALMILQV